jgi:glycosyltransferase involved in cell wall biosynthesis
MLHPEKPRWPADLIALIPLYNHAQTVAQVIAWCQSLGAPEILVIDDGSTDDGPQNAQRAGAIVRHMPGNHGKGAALRAGLTWAQGQGYRRAITIDADAQHPKEAIAKMVLAAQRSPHAFVLGKRRMQHAPWPSRLGRALTGLATFLLTGHHIRDNQSGLRILPIASVLHLKSRAKGYAWEPEIIVEALWRGYQVQEVSVPVVYDTERISHFCSWKDTLRTGAVFGRLALLPKTCAVSR